jgi:hypothetical protein
MMYFGIVWFASGYKPKTLGHLQRGNANVRANEKWAYTLLQQGDA